LNTRDFLSGVILRGFCLALHPEQPDTLFVGFADFQVKAA
jgi:hypothetical protein